MKLDDLIKYLIAFEKDKKLNVWHFSILNAILCLGFIQGEDKIIRVSRRKIMAIAHINTIPTYHKYFKQLQEMGYIQYRPSYHPGYRSEVELLKP